MANITTDFESFENIDYPKNIYELLLQLKNEPLHINCNSENSQSILENISIDEIYTGRKMIYLNQSLEKVSKPLYTKLFIFPTSLTFIDVTTLNIDFLRYNAIFKDEFSVFFKLPITKNVFGFLNSKINATNFLLDINFVKEENYFYLQNIIQQVNFIDNTFSQLNQYYGTIYLFLEYTKTTDLETPII